MSLAVIVIHKASYGKGHMTAKQDRGLTGMKVRPREQSLVPDAHIKLRADNCGNLLLM